PLVCAEVARDARERQQDAEPRQEEKERGPQVRHQVSDSHPHWPNLSMRSMRAPAYDRPLEKMPQARHVPTTRRPCPIVLPDDLPGQKREACSRAPLDDAEANPVGSRPV